MIYLYTIEHWLKTLIHCDCVLIRKHVLIWTCFTWDQNETLHFVSVDIVAVWPDTDPQRSSRKMEFERTQLLVLFATLLHLPHFYALLTFVRFTQCTCLCSDMSHLVLNICAKSHICCHIVMICVWQRSQTWICDAQYSKFIHNIAEAGTIFFLSLLIQNV